VTVPPLSVVLPVHNGMPYVEESVRSILAQTFADFEFVIGDDGSSDGTTETLRRLAAEDPRIRLLRREAASGLAASANWVVSEARAPLIAVAHADDRARPERLARQMEILRDMPDVDLVGTLWDGIDEKGVTVRPADHWRLLRRSPFAPFSHSSIMLRRAAFDRAGGYRARAEYWEDLDLYYRIAERGRVVVVPEVLSTVRHARISTRLRDGQEKVETMVDRMFRTVEAVAGGADPETALGEAAPAPNRLHPMTFVSCGSTRLWTGRSPKVYRRMRERARLGLDAASAHALAWVVWGTTSPRSLRFFLRTLLHLRNVIARPLLKGRRIVDWTPRG
jgi:cellulose synthase/poly-beta-1,6-N-acetylglucosamine synthase-like glycosyltransferase